MIIGRQALSWPSGPVVKLTLVNTMMVEDQGDSTLQTVYLSATGTKYHRYTCSTPKSTKPRSPAAKQSRRDMSPAKCANLDVEKVKQERIVMIIIETFRFRWLCRKVFCVLNWTYLH